MENSLVIKNTRLLLFTLSPAKQGGRGKNLFLNISDIINKIYSTTTKNADDIVGDIFERSQAILAKDSPFNVKANIPHTDNVRKFSIANRPVNPIIVYIYENNNMIKGSPFASYSAAQIFGIKT